MLSNAIQYNFEQFDAIQKICAPLSDYIGVSLIHYRRFYLGGGLISLFNHMDWMKISFEKKYWYSSVLSNKLSSLLEKDSLYYLWPEKPLTNDALYCELFDQNIWNGITIYKKNVDYIESYAFASTRNCVGVTGIYFSEIELLEHFISYFRSSIVGLMGNTEKKIIIPCSLGLGKDSKSDKNDLRKKFINETAIKTFYLRHDGNDIKLTKRESECLALLSYGKQVKEVARLLKLSPRTVETYLNDVKWKTKCNTKSQAVLLYQQQNTGTTYINEILQNCAQDF